MSVSSKMLHDPIIIYTYVHFYQFTSYVGGHIVFIET